MRLRGEEYSKRLEGYSTSTLKLMHQVSMLSAEEYQKGRDITTNSELSEEEVVEQLKALLESQKT